MSQTEGGWALISDSHLSSNIKDDHNGLTVADYMVSRIAADGIDTVFGIVGGGIMYLVDAIARSKDVHWVACHHEEFAGVAADGYARAGKPYGVAIGTTGPGVAHLFTAVAAAWQDSIPTVFIAGQVKSQDSSSIQGLKLRHNGTFEFDSLESFRPITKRVSILRSGATVVEEMETLIAAAVSGRPGPVLLEIPLDIQREPIILSVNQARGSRIQDQPGLLSIAGQLRSVTFETSILERELSTSARPLVLIGAGVVRAESYEPLTASLDSAGIPYVVTQLARQAGNLNHALYLGSPGIKANRSANLAVTECDLLIAIGTSLHQQVVGWDQELFKRLPSKKIWFEIDQNVITARQHMVDIAIELPSLEASKLICNVINTHTDTANWTAWEDRCKELRAQHLLHYPVHDEEDNRMCLYRATTALSEHAADYSVAVTDAGIVWYTMAQHYFPSPGTSYLSSGSFGSMGMALPYAIGAAAATKQRVLAFTGDGSLMMCLSELATLRETQLPVVLVINSNRGYRSIKATQDRYFDGRRLGTDQDHGLFIPSFREVADLFGIEYFRAQDVRELDAVLNVVRSTELRPIIVEVFTYEDQAVEPAVESRVGIDGSMTSGSLADMSPRLD